MRAVVVGAGLSGLMAARELRTAGHDVTVLDKGRSVGGRLATRRIAGARVDHGAQFFTVRSDTFGGIVDGWLAGGLVRPWHHGLDGDGHPRYVAPDGMNAIARHLERGLDVRCSTLAFAISATGDGWRVGLDDGRALDTDAVVVTCPVPQSFALLVTAGLELPEGLRTLDYDRTLALLAVLDRPGAVPPPGAAQPANGVFSFVGDNAAKGVSSVPALTLHANATWSEARWDGDRDEVLAELLDAARPWFGDATVVEAQVKRWRFATPRTTWHEPCWVAPGAASLVLAGDAFAGPRVEGAALSGLAAGAALR